ncbi:hypothetical protein BJ912DRAFT_971632 [Pholiota molesta]|nr:hypothetical protein BJ912DRAFT_971632 [Pholiota molesta]
MKFTLPSLWFLALFLGYWASIVHAYPLGNPSPASLSASIRVEGIEAHPVHLARSWTRSDDFEDLEARKLYVQSLCLSPRYLKRS